MSSSNKSLVKEALKEPELAAGPSYHQHVHAQVWTRHLQQHGMRRLCDASLKLGNPCLDIKHPLGPSGCSWGAHQVRESWQGVATPSLCAEEWRPAVLQGDCRLQLSEVQRCVLAL